MLQVLKRAGGALGDAIDDVIGVVNPHTVVLGGYLAALSAHLMTSIEERIAHRLAIPAFAATKVVAVEQNVPGLSAALFWPPATPASTTRSP